MLTAGDIISRIKGLPNLLRSDEIQRVLVAHAKSCLTYERWVNFGDAGGPSDARLSVDGVVIDLPVTWESDGHNDAISSILSYGDHVKKLSMSSGLPPRHVVITGAPGNGKTTIGKFLTQVYRTRLLEATSMPRKVTEVAEGTVSAMKRLGIAMPRNRRWPMRIELTELADSLGPSGDKSLLRWLSEKIKARSDLDLSPAELKEWMRTWPWFVVFDGLDEVTSPTVRQRILDEIQLLVDTADEIDADLFIIVTTRPTGYTERINPAEFQQCNLQYLDEVTAASYGKLITTQRLSDDPDRRERLLRRFEGAMKEALTKRLLKTPLQVLMLIFILERMGSLPANRYQLFWRYYETVYDREASKPTSLATSLANYRGEITELHERVGLILQARSELAGDSQSRLQRADLEQIALSRLVEVGYQPQSGTARKIVADVVIAAMQRLVLLVGTEHDTVSFEIRSLQELMAARALASGGETSVGRRLSSTAPSPHWRNTWLFAAGYIFSEKTDHDRDALIEIVEKYDKDPTWPGWLCPIGPELAADMLDDNLTVNRPRWQRRLVDVTLRSLGGPFIDRTSKVSLGLSAAAAADSQTRLYIRNAVKTALAGTPVSNFVANSISLEAKLGPSLPGLEKNFADRLQPWLGRPPAGEMVSVGSLLRRGLQDLDLPEEATAQIEAATHELSDLLIVKAKDGRYYPRLPISTGGRPNTRAALLDESMSMNFELLCGGISAEKWVAVSLVSRALSPGLVRRPVGHVLTSSGLGWLPHPRLASVDAKAASSPGS